MLNAVKWTTSDWECSWGLEDMLEHDKDAGIKNRINRAKGVM